MRPLLVAAEVPFAGQTSMFNVAGGSHGESIVWCDANPLDLTWSGEFAAGSSASVVITWSGTLAEEPFTASPHNWMHQGLAALDTFIANWLDANAGTSRSLWLRPHALHILSDGPSCRLFHKRYGDRIGLVLSPGDMISCSMASAAAEHIERLFEFLGPVCSGVWLETTSIDRAASERLTIEALLERHVPPQVPVIAHARHAETIGHALWPVAGR